MLGGGLSKRLSYARADIRLEATRERLVACATQCDKRPGFSVCERRTGCDMVQFALAGTAAPRTQPKPHVPFKERKRRRLDSQSVAQPVCGDRGTSHGVALMCYRALAFLTPKAEMFASVREATTTPIRFRVAERSATLKPLKDRRIHRGAANDPIFQAQLLPRRSRIAAFSRIR